MGRLDGKVCVIIGAAAGIGAETARRFSEEAANGIGADITDEEQASARCRQARDEFGRIDVLFNNAGINPTDDGSVLETSVASFQRVQDVNLLGVFLCCKHGIPHLLDSGGGSVINTASFVALLGAATSQIGYTASK